MRKDNWYEATPKATIHGVLWMPEVEPVGIIQIAHGVTEYIDRYEEFANIMTQKGFIVCGNDHRGHGASYTASKVPMYLGEKDSWYETAEDLYKVSCRMKKDFPDLPYVLVGFSMGSFLVRTALINYPDIADAAIIMGTGQQSSIALKLAKFMAAKEEKKYGYAATTQKIDELTFGTYNKKFKPNNTKFDWLCADPQALEEYLLDPRRGDSMTVGLFSEMLEGMEFTADIKNIREMNLNIPILFMSGEDDPVGENGRGVKKAAKAFHRAGVKTIDVVIYEGCRHDILHDYCKSDVYADIIEWLKFAIHFK